MYVKLIWHLRRLGRFQGKESQSELSFKNTNIYKSLIICKKPSNPCRKKEKQILINHYSARHYSGLGKVTNLICYSQTVHSKLLILHLLTKHLYIITFMTFIYFLFNSSIFLPTCLVLLGQSLIQKNQGCWRNSKENFQGLIQKMWNFQGWARENHL